MAVALAVLACLGAWLVWWAIQLNVVVLLADLNQWMADTFIRRLGYFGVFALMFIESSFIPFPSEIVIPPAGDLARRLPDWELGWVIFWGTAGSLGGAMLNYFLARLLGRPLITSLVTRFGRYVRISETGYQKAEDLFSRHGAISTLTGRLIPGIRQIISLPAGLARMNLLSFCLLTSIGAGFWVAVLAYLGYWFGADPERMGEMLKEYSRWLIVLALLFFGGYALFQWLRLKKQNASP